MKLSEQETHIATLIMAKITSQTKLTPIGSEGQDRLLVIFYICLRTWFNFAITVVVQPVPLQS